MSKLYSLALRNGIYYADFKSLDGKRQRVSTGMPDRAKADKEAAKLFRLHLSQATVTEKRTLSAGFAKMWERGEKWESLRSPFDLKHRIEEICSILGGDTKLDRIGTVQMNHLRTMLLKGGDGKRTQATVQRYMHCLTAMMRCAARDWQWIEYVPAYKPLAKATTRDVVLSDSQVRLLLAGETRTSFQRLWLMLVETGARLGETLSLDWDDIDLEQGIVHFPASITKTLTAKTLPLSDGVLSALRASKDSGAVKPFPVNKNTAQAYFKQTVRALGLPDAASIHTLRHTCATKIVATTGNLKLAQQQLGHATIATTARYAKADIRQLETVKGMFS